MSPKRKHLSSPLVFSGVRVTRSLLLSVCFVDRCLSFCTFSFGNCVVCLLRFTDFDYPFGIFKLFLFYLIYVEITLSKLTVSLHTSWILIQCQVDVADWNPLFRESGIFDTLNSKENKLWCKMFISMIQLAKQCTCISTRSDEHKCLFLISVSQDFKIIWLSNVLIMWAYIINVIKETCRAH